MWIYEINHVNMELCAEGRQIHQSVTVQDRLHNGPVETKWLLVNGILLIEQCGQNLNPKMVFGPHDGVQRENKREDNLDKD